MRPRYVIRTTTGFAGNGSQNPTTDVMVLDTWNAWRVVWNYRAERSGRRLHVREAFALDLCDRLNAETEAALA